MSAAPHMTFEDAKLGARQLKAHHEFHRVLAGGSPGAHLISPCGVEALVVPACPWFSVINCVFAYESALALEEALPELNRAYAGVGVSSYRVSVPAEDEHAATVLTEHGFARKGSALRMASFLRGQDLGQRRSLDLVAQPTWETIARCNDRVYGLPSRWTTAKAFSSLDHSAFHLYAVRAGGDVVSVVASHESEGNCYICFMATVPEAQRSGIGVELVRLVKRQARKHGCESSSGESSVSAEHLYLKGGARILGRLGLWERRFSSPV